jgi:hypothetical protein
VRVGGESMLPPASQRAPSVLFSTLSAAIYIHQSFLVRLLLKIAIEVPKSSKETLSRKQIKKMLASLFLVNVKKSLSSHEMRQMHKHAHGPCNNNSSLFDGQFIQRKFVVLMDIHSKKVRGCLYVIAMQLFLTKVTYISPHLLKKQSACGTREFFGIFELHRIRCQEFSSQASSP